MNRTRWNRTRGTSAPSARPPPDGSGPGEHVGTAAGIRAHRAHAAPIGTEGAPRAVREILDATGRLPAASFDRQAPLRNRTKWNRTKWNRTKWNRTKWNRTKWNRTKWNRTRWNRTRWNRTRWKWTR
jgi:hypothetical protein